MHDHYVALGVLFFLMCVITASVLYSVGANWQVFLSVFGGLFTFIFFVQKHQLDEAKFVNELIIKFNQRYDALNNDLNDLFQLNKSISEFSSSDRNLLFDYFNLCGEEYLFFKKGYIYPEVWESWVAGMKQFHEQAGIQEFWETELRLGSYYKLDVASEIQRLKNLTGRTQELTD